MADITIIRNGARISLASFPKIGSGSENIMVAVNGSGEYSNYTAELYYGFYVGGVMQQMLAKYSSGVYTIPANALFNAGNFYLTVRLVNGNNKVSTNTIPVTIEKSAVNNDYSILPASETWQSAVDNYISYTNSKLENVSNKADNNEARINNNESRINNLVANTGDSNSEIVDARVDADGHTHSTLGNAIRTNIEMLRNGKQGLYGIEETIDLSSYTITGKLYNVHDNVELDGKNYKYAKISYDGSYDVICASGYSESSNWFPFLAFKDSSNNSISHVFKANTAFENYITAVPSNTAYIIINSNNEYKLELKKVSKRDLNYDIKEIKDSLESKEGYYGEYENIDLSSDIVNGEWISTTGEVYKEKLAQYVKVAYDGSYKFIRATGISNVDVYPFIIFKDSNDKLISTIFKLNTEFVNYECKIPSDTAYIIINGHKYNAPIKLEKMVKRNLREDIENIKNSLLNTCHDRWYGKKIGVLGTSVAYGSNATKSYAKEACESLGATLKQFAVPGLAIHTKSDGKPMIYGSLTLSKEEYASNDFTIQESPLSYIPGSETSYNNYYRTWENVFTAENADIDLWIYAVSPNNVEFSTTDWNSFNKTNWSYDDGSSFSDHRTTFLGALLFLMDKMYALNPNARMVLLLDSAFAYGDGKKCFELLKSQWNIPIIDLWGKINTSPKSLSVIKSKSGTDNHPSTFGQEKMGEMLTGELQLIS